MLAFIALTKVSTHRLPHPWARGAVPPEKKYKLEKITL